MSAELILIRGLPGSGKSTLAKKFVGFKHLEADDFFMHGDKYLYDPSKIKNAHIRCQSEAWLSLQQGVSVVVANTFSRKWEMQPYLDMCKELHIPYTIITVHGDYANVHNVPQAVIQKMKERWET